MSVPAPTGRLAFRPPAAGDLEFTAELLSHTEVMRCYPKPLSRAEASARHSDSGRDRPRGRVERKSGGSAR